MPDFDAGDDLSICKRCGVNAAKGAGGLHGTREWEWGGTAGRRRGRGKSEDDVCVTIINHKDRNSFAYMCDTY